MTPEYRLARSRKAVQQLEDIVLDVLILHTKQGKISEAHGLYPRDIAQDLPALVIEPFPPRRNRHSLICGILDSLAREGRIAHANNGGAYLVDMI
ncbi:MAG: hypothetical protein OXK78_11830 [Caldilineaceae bacterium]|nr:hypothetical protein [Caldilineaceae bacterium]